MSKGGGLRGIGALAAVEAGGLSPETARTFEQSLEGTEVVVAA